MDNSVLPELPTHREAPAAPVLPWGDHFRVGIESLDADHYALVQLINGICAAWHAGDRTSALAAFDALRDLAERHFRHEQEVFRSLPGTQALSSHARQYRKRLAQLDALGAQLRSRQESTGAPQLADELIDWFVHQSIGEDAVIKSYFHDGRYCGPAGRGFRRPASAPHRDERNLPPRSCLKRDRS